MKPSEWAGLASPVPLVRFALERFPVEAVALVVAECLRTCAEATPGQDSSRSRRRSLMLSLASKTLRRWATGQGPLTEYERSATAWNQWVANHDPELDDGRLSNDPLKSTQLCVDILREVLMPVPEVAADRLRAEAAAPVRQARQRLIAAQAALDEADAEYSRAHALLRKAFELSERNLGGYAAADAFADYEATHAAAQEAWDAAQHELELAQADVEDSELTVATDVSEIHFHRDRARPG